MPFTEKQPAIHAGNYYTPGVKRVLAKLAVMGINVPTEALTVPKNPGIGTPLVEFTLIEHAMLDWFEGRDYEQAQALIHYRPPRDKWHVVRVLDEDKCPREITHDMLCRTRDDAIEAMVYGCDQDSLRFDACRLDGNALIVTVDGNDVARIEQIELESFDRTVRDRVRTAFKGVRQFDMPTLCSRAKRIPGLEPLGDNDRIRDGAGGQGCLFLGYPGNWAFAMRNALKQVGIEVKQSQAQELASVFFGASNWHQLVKHQDELNDGMEPVVVSYETPIGRQQRFYCTPEEAFFAVGAVLKNYPEPVVVTYFCLTSDNRRISLFAKTRREFGAATRDEKYLDPTCIESGTNDYRGLRNERDPVYTEIAQKVLAKLERAGGSISTQDLLYKRHDTQGMLEGLLNREGLPADHLVYLGGHALAVFHLPGPNGGRQLTPQVRVYRISEDRANKIGDVAMYKAEVEVDEIVGGSMLVIRPDYGKGKRIEIPFTDIEQLRRLLALTHADNLFTSRMPRFNTTEVRRQH